MKKSPWIIHYDASSCNGCDIETLACLTPGFDVERLGVVNTGNPKHADIFLVTGAVNPQSAQVIENIYRQMPEPRVVVAVGTCACSGGIFRECYNISGGVDTVVPVDVYVPGCAARPEAIIDGVVQGLAALEEKCRQRKSARPRRGGGAAGVGGETLMMQEQNIEAVAAGALLDKVRTLKAAGYRLVQLCATTLPEQFELLYSFDRESRLTTLRVILPLEFPRMPSISGIYGAAMLYENEMHDLFKIEVEGMSVDFHGTLYRTTVKYPMGSKKAPSAAPAAGEVAAAAPLVK